MEMINKRYLCLMGSYFSSITEYIDEIIFPLDCPDCNGSQMDCLPFRSFPIIRTYLASGDPIP
jgi:hypothetical protein